jgi:hypothetical protein
VDIHRSVTFSGRHDSIDADPSWQGSVLLRDIGDVKRLRQEGGRNLVTQGSTEIAHYERAGAIKIGDTALDSPSA